MKELTIRIKNFSNIPFIYVNDKRAPLKKDHYRGYVVTVPVESSETKINIILMKHELSGDNWFIKWLIFFIISGFGLFNEGYTKNNYSLDYQGTIDTKESCSVELFIERCKGGESPAIISESDLFIDNPTNRYVFDESIPDKLKKIKRLKRLTWFLILMTIIATVYFLNFR